MMSPVISGHEISTEMDSMKRLRRFLERPLIPILLDLMDAVESSHQLTGSLLYHVGAQ